MAFHPLVLIVSCFTVSLLIHGGQPADESSQKWSNICPRDKCQTIDFSLKNEIIIKAKGIYCIKPLTRPSLKGFLHIWHMTEIRHNSSKGSVLVNANSTEFVTKNTESSGSFWQQNDNGVSVLRLTPFDINCVGVIKSGKDTIAFSRRLLIFYPVFLLVALILFYSAPKLTRNPKFYYSSGIAIGILASLLVLLYFFGKLVPKKNIIGLFVLLGGYSFAAYITHWMYSQGIDFLRDNWLYLLIYMITAGFISFAILYRVGPAHVRTLQLIQWLLQFISLIFLYFSFSQIPVIAVIAVLGLLVHYNTPLSISRQLKALFFRMSFFLKPKIKKKLLTVEEYEEQGRIETEKALRNLRNDCRFNPEFWDNKLENITNQSRFLDFMSGKDHVSNSQREVHEREYPSWYDDSDDDDADVSDNSSTASPQLSSSYNSSSSSPRQQQYYHYYYN